MTRAFQPRHAVLTGAAGAIGGALARTLAVRYGALRLTLVDRDEEGLAALAAVLPGETTTLPWDLGRIDSLPDLWRQATERAGPVDLLVNCAGFMEIRSFGATPWALGQRLLDVDLLCPLRLMELAVSGMPADGGWIVNVCSMAGRVPLRGCTYYGAAKGGLALASRIAGLELSPRGIHVLTVLPGPVRSGLESRARGQVRQGLVSRYIPTGDPERLAVAIDRALVRRRPRLVYPRIYYLADWFPGLHGWITATFSPEPTDD